MLVEDSAEESFKDNFLSQPIFRTCVDGKEKRSASVMIDITNFYFNLDIFAVANPTWHLLPRVYVGVRVIGVISFDVTCVTYPSCNIPKNSREDFTNYEGKNVLKPDYPMSPANLTLVSSCSKDLIRAV